ncbi:hypothetical protein [Citrobacter braakii]|uniref:hypothetical protein n=1 Tax=Citrobacter braakii TaxID=57706 RepID=UPI002B244E46|nr:hypothetical protein [Citrobacter braakii]MEB2306459.1 hypothetical protein [Citrobacter braakii]
MGLDDFGLSILAGFLANRFDFLKPNGTPAQMNEVIPEVIEEPDKFSLSANLPIKFKTFDVWSDLDKLLKVVKEPKISVLIEEQPSTYYRLPSLVLESRITGEWYVFPRGRISFEGNGGGIQNAEVIFNQLKEENVSVGIWVIDQALLDRLDNGHEFWPTIRLQIVPFLAAPSSEYSWTEIQRNVAKLTEFHLTNY